MKKTTLFALLLILPFLGMSQTFDFTNTDDGFTDLNKLSGSTNATFFTLTGNVTDPVSKNPTFANPNGNINADTNGFLAITLRNNDASGPDFLRFSFPRASDNTKRTFVNLDITTGDSEFQTYFFSLEGEDGWEGTEVDDIKFHFKSAGNSDYEITTAFTVDLDKIEFMSSLPVTSDNTYTFGSSEEGWDDTTRCTVSAVGGNLEVQLAGSGTVGDTNNSKVKLNPLFSINATGNPFFHITLKNNTNDDQLKIVYPDGAGGNVTVTQIISTNDADFVTYDFNLGSNPAWTGEIQGVELVFDDQGGQEGTGVFQIDSIIVDNALSTSDVSVDSVSISPNPANTVIQIKGFNNLAKVELFDITGKKVLEANNLVNNKLNVETLITGVYLVRLSDTNNIIKVKKLIIQ